MVTKSLLSISKTITPENWDDKLMDVLEFLHNYDDWEEKQYIKQIRINTNKSFIDDMQPVLQEMLSRVRFFQAQGYSLEPPEELDFEVFRGIMVGQNIYR
jgi:hypothetical protein